MTNIYRCSKPFPDEPNNIWVLAVHNDTTAFCPGPFELMSKQLLAKGMLGSVRELRTHCFANGTRGFSLLCGGWRKFEMYDSKSSECCSTTARKRLSRAWCRKAARWKSCTEPDRAALLEAEVCRTEQLGVALADFNASYTFLRRDMGDSWSQAW
eukprot:CAMPEP_0181473028 /NCGR_PEP_ID=MMETSP1110-20121109/39911_1 /TAXON_ID=174948 /ORGANISM="Symbiodinium sp., Strain CCMP421" /LENGTH=154 /DNA_ID=CAMNT_0023598129 /DNA_START=306 /DNA_END=767 /DNA_ORIENTATION=+